MNRKEDPLVGRAALLLAFVSVRPRASFGEIALVIGVDERSVSRLLRELEHAGYLTRTREGNRNTYRVHRDQQLQHRQLAGSVGDYLDAVRIELRPSAFPEAMGSTTELD